MGAKTLSRWTIRAVEELKAELKLELVAVAPEKRLDHLLAAIARLELDHSPEGAMRRYVRVMSALVHHARDGGLSDQMPRRLAELAEAILLVGGITRANRRLGQLCGDVHLARSQILRREGRLWEAAWEQVLGESSGDRDESRETGAAAIGAASRALRLGFAPVAATRLKELLARLPQDSPRYPLAALMLAKTLRLAGLRDQATARLDALAGMSSLDPALLQEARWEGLCNEASRDCDLHALSAATEREGTHFSADYCFEAFLWAHASHRHEWRERLPKVRTLARAGRLGKADLRLVAAAAVLEQCYDATLPSDVRLDKLGIFLQDGASQLAGIEYHLLVLAAAARWLVRAKNHDFGELVLAEYRAKSLALSDGTSGDVLGLLTDLTIPRSAKKGLPWSA